MSTLNMNAKLIFLGLAALVAMASSSTELDALRSGNAKFSSDLFSAMRVGKENENLVVSPISLQIALAMVYAGAGGSTKAMLSKVLHVETDDALKYIMSYKELLDTIKDPVLSVASTVFVDKTVKLQDAYANSISAAFGANVESVTFQEAEAAAKTINDWCSKNTNGKIKDMFKAAELADTLSVLANAVYFKASWKTKFDVARTLEKDFKSPTGVVKVQMMNVKSEFHYTYSTRLDAHVLELPYANEKFRMIVILPTEGKALKDVENSLKTVGLEEVMKEMYKTEVDVYLPRFKIEMTMELNEALKSLGAGELFGPGANFTGMTNTPLRISQVKQKVFIEVTEEGTEAAAVTGLNLKYRSLGMFDLNFNANKPFLFLISNENLVTVVSGSFENAGKGYKPENPSAHNDPNSPRSITTILKNL